MNIVYAVYLFYQDITFVKFVEFKSSAEALAYKQALSDSLQFAATHYTHPYLSAYDVDNELDRIRELDKKIVSRLKKVGIKTRVKN